LRRLPPRGWLLHAGALLLRRSNIPIFTTLIHDQFTDSDDTLLKDHSVLPINTPGNAWGVTADKWKITSNYAQASESSQFNPVAIDAGVADARVSADIWALLNQSSGDARKLPCLIGRLKDNSNYWGFGLYPGDDVAALIERASGSSVIRASMSVAIDHQTWYTVQLSFAGDVISGHVGDKSVSYTSSNLNSYKKFGLKSNMDTTSDRFDNFKVEVQV